MFKWLSSLFKSDFLNWKNQYIYILIFLLFLTLNVFFNSNEFIYWNKIYDLNFFYSNFLKLNFFYLFDFFLKNFYIFIDFFYHVFTLFFYNNINSNFNLDKILFVLNINEYNIFIDNGLSTVGSYYFNFFNKLNYIFYNFLFSFNEYLYHIIIYSYNLPIFFYFGILFIFTTIFSLILLSYLGLYGVFLLNMITLFFFWFSTLLYANK